MAGEYIPNGHGEIEIQNSPGMIAALTAKGHEGIAISKSLFAAESKHESTPPVEYEDSFGVRITHGEVPTAEVYNDDRTAEWVEFGAHPGGGQTEVLKYRILGRTLDILEGHA